MILETNAIAIFVLSTLKFTVQLFFFKVLFLCFSSRHIVINMRFVICQTFFLIGQAHVKIKANKACINMNDGLFIYCIYSCNPTK